MTFPPNRYRDDNPLCTRTYATFRLIHATADPEEVTRRLEIAPSDLQRVGELRRRREEEWIEVRRPNRDSRWTLTSDEQFESRDALRHIDWVLDMVEDLGPQIASLVEEGWHATMAVYWESAVGDDGPTVSARTMRRLADLNLPLWFDVYFPYDEPPRIAKAIDAYNARVLAQTENSNPEIAPEST